MNPRLCKCGSVLPKFKQRCVKCRLYSKAEPEGECLVWQGSTNPDGYGRLAMKGGNQSAHRLAWELAHGPIPDDTCVLHSCDNPPCIQVSHLFLGSHADNMQDMHNKGRKGLGPTEVREIREALAAGDTQRSLAKAYGVGQQTISHIHQRQTWRSV